MEVFKRNRLVEKRMLIDLDVALQIGRDRREKARFVDQREIQRAEFGRLFHLKDAVRSDELIQGFFLHENGYCTHSDAAGVGGGKLVLASFQREKRPRLIEFQRAFDIKKRFDRLLEESLVVVRIM